MLRSGAIRRRFYCENPSRKNRNVLRLIHKQEVMPAPLAPDGLGPESGAKDICGFPA